MQNYGTKYLLKTASFVTFLSVISASFLVGQSLTEESLVHTPESLGIGNEVKSSPTLPEVMALNEEFLYHVSYGFFHLGEVRVIMHKDTVYNGEPAILFENRMKANSSLPFVGYKEEHFKSFLTWDGENLVERYFFVDDLDDNKPKEIEYIFNYEINKVICKKGGVVVDSLELKPGASGGDIVFMLSRVNAFDGGSYKMPVYVNYNEGPLTAATTKIGEMRSYKAFTEDVLTIRSEGLANFEGPFGFSGKFTSWFAADSTRIPLEAHAKVWVGNVKVRLERYRSW
jgi:hypothetical protein